MRYLIDSDWIIDWLMGRPAAIRLFQALATEELAISLITVGEVYEGIYFGRDPEATERAFLDLLQWIEVLPLDQAIMRRFARLRGDLRRRGQPIGDADLLIAATAMHHGATLVTRNVAHFRRLSDLRLSPGG